MLNTARPRQRIPATHEVAYRLSVAPRILQILHFGGIAGMIAVPAFTVNDLLFDPDAVSRTLPVRLAVAAVIGVRKFAFDLWGDTVNIASRLEATCPRDSIQLSSETAEMIGADFSCAPLGETDLPGHTARQTFRPNGEIISTAS